MFSIKVMQVMKRCITHLLRLSLEVVASRSCMHIGPISAAHMSTLSVSHKSNATGEVLQTRFFDLCVLFARCVVRVRETVPPTMFSGAYISCCHAVTGLCRFKFRVAVYETPCFRVGVRGDPCRPLPY